MNQTRNIGSTNNLALASLLLSIAFVLVGPLGSIGGLICGKIALREYRTANITEGTGMARAGVILGWIGIVLTLLGIAITFAAILFISNAH